jgi:hypothetical protein
LGGDCYRGADDKYYLVELRLEKKTLPTCITGPEVDSKITELRDKNINNKK